MRIMDPGAEWSVVFYQDHGGRSPVREFLEGLDDEAQQSIGWAIEQLRIRNVQVREPLVRHVEGKLWELRRDSRRNAYRLLYFFFHGCRIVFIHGFQKKTRTTPRAEIEVAQARYARFVQEHGGE
jgi:phage-related protein